MRSYHIDLHDVCNDCDRSKIIERLWLKVDKTDSCWMWTGSKGHGGYGRISLRLVPHTLFIFATHRLSWEIHFGPIPEGLWVLHNCPDGDNACCVNPAHLWLGTHQDNDRDRTAKGRTVSGCKLNPECAVKGEAHPNSKLNNEDVIKIRELAQSGEKTLQEIADMFHIAKQTVFRLKHMLIWKHIK